MLAACATDRVVVEPAALPPVAPQLLQSVLARCALPARPDHDPREVMAYARCWEAAYHAAAARHIGLGRAVEVRERAIKAALAARAG